MATTDSDAKVRENILDKLRHDIRIDASNIAVSIHGGVELVKLPNLLRLLMGGWEMLAPFALGYADLTVPTTSDIVVGFLVVLCAAIRLFKVERTAWLSWVIAALGLWLVLAPFVLGYVTIPGPATNDVGIGTFTFVFGIWGALATAPLRTE